MHMENDFHLADRNNMNKDKVTIHDVARAANVSPATVSRVLNNSDHDKKIKLTISEELRRLNACHE